jgi:serine protease AprX
MHCDRVITLRRLVVPLLVALLAALVGPATPAQAGPLQTWVVTFDRPPTVQQLDVLRGATDAVHGFTAVPAAVVVAPTALVPLLRGLPGVRGVWANERYQPLLSSATTASRARQVWDELGWTGAGVTVAVIDAGVDGTHPDLCAAALFCKGTGVKVVQNVKVVGRQDVAADPVVYLEDQLSTDSSSGHGSHVAGIVGGFGTASATPGKYRGVAPGAGIVGYGTGELVEAVNVLAAYDHAIAHRDEYGIRVINNSWGPGAFTDYDPEHPVNRATDAAWAAGISVVFGAGNDGTRTDSLNMFSSHPRAISAGGGRKDGQQAFFSSKGVPGSAHWHPTVTAPGEAIVSVRASTGFTMAAADASGGTDNPDAASGTDTAFYAASSGTSMAAPHVSGIIALVQQAARATHGRWLTPLEVRNLLQNTARPMPGYQHYSVGAGYVDAYAAVQAAVAGTGTRPYDDGTTYDVAPFAGSVGPAAYLSTSTFSSTFDVAAGARSLDVMADWGPEQVVPANQDLDISLYRPDGTLFRNTFLTCDPTQQPNGYSSFCSSAPNERLSVVGPVPGTWRVEVHGGLATVSETVRGLWSAAYPDALAPVRANTAAALTLTAATPASLAGQSVLLTATVRDAAGLPVPNAPISWSGAGVGAVGSAEVLTDANGRAVALARSGAPGTQTATATTGALTASASVLWLGVVLPALPCVLGCVSPAPQSTPGSVRGGGWFTQTTKRRLAVSVEKVGAGAPAGELSYDDKAGTVVESSGVDSLVVDGTSAAVTGSATVNGSSGYRFRLTVDDGGKDDAVTLLITRPGSTWRHEAAGTLGGGNLQVR